MARRQPFENLCAQTPTSPCFKGLKLCRPCNYHFRKLFRKPPDLAAIQAAPFEHGRKGQENLSPSSENNNINFLKIILIFLHNMNHSGVGIDKKIMP